MQFIFVFFDFGIYALMWLCAYLFGTGLLVSIVDFLVGPGGTVIAIVFFLIICILGIKIYFGKSFLKRLKAEPLITVVGALENAIAFTIKHITLLVLGMVMIVNAYDTFNGGLVGVLFGPVGTVLAAMAFCVITCMVMLTDVWFSSLCAKWNPIIIGFFNIMVACIIVIILIGWYLNGNEGTKIVFRSFPAIGKFYYGEWLVDSFDYLIDNCAIFELISHMI